MIGMSLFLLIASIAIVVACLLLAPPSRFRFLSKSLSTISCESQFLGLDILYQDLWDLQHHNSSNRALVRHNRNGHTYTSSVFGHDTIHTINRENILAVTTGNFGDYEKGNWARTIAKYMGDGVLVNDGVAWHASRALLRPLFRRNRATDVKIFEPHTDRLIQHIENQQGEITDFRRAVQMAVLDITTEMLTGKSTLSLSKSGSHIGQKTEIASQGPELLDLIDELEPYGNTSIELGIFALPILVVHYWRIMALITGIQGFFKTTIDNVLSKRRTSTTEESGFIGDMLDQNMQPPEVQGALQNIFFAAFDTTTALIVNFFDCVARQPETVERLHAELVIVVGNKPLTEADIPHLTYLKATIFETLRLHSPVTSHTRKARVSTVLPRGGGPEGQSSLLVSRGMAVTWSTYTLNRQAEIYGPDCGEFRPERWLTDDGTFETKDAFMPFGSGPRNCLGQQFAMLEASYIIARVLSAFHRFQIEDTPFLEAAAVTHYNGRGTHIRFNPVQCQI
jgi:cytochrome P450